MNRSNRLVRTIAVSFVAALGCLVEADTGSPPPPSISEARLVPVSRAQTRLFYGQVLPAYQAWLIAGSRSNTYPAFLLFVAVYPCSQTDRAAFVQLYLEAFPP